MRAFLNQGLPIFHEILRQVSDGNIFKERIKGKPFPCEQESPQSTSSQRH